MKSIGAFVGIGLVGFTAICGICQPGAEAAQLASLATAVGGPVASSWAVRDTVKLKIEGMTCGGCAVSARLVLKKLAGVEEAKVDYDTKSALVTYDPAKVTPEKMIEALKTRLKYTATVVRDSLR